MTPEPIQMCSGAGVKDIDAFNKLLQGEISAVDIYRRVIKFFGSDGSEELVACLRSHESRAERLRHRVVELGGSPIFDTGPWGTLLQLLERGAEVLGRSTALAALEEAEDHGLAEYREVIEELDPSSRELVEAELLPEQHETHQIVRRLCQPRSSAAADGV